MNYERLSTLGKEKFIRSILWGYIILIFVLAVLAINGKESVLNNNYIFKIRLDYLVHFGIFIPLMWLASKAYNVNFHKNIIKTVFWILIGFCIAGLSEGIQFFIPYRSFNINDLAANGIGVVLGTAFFLVKKKKTTTDCTD